MLNATTNKSNSTSLSATQLTAMVDEFSELHQQVTALKPVIDRYERLKKQLANVDTYSSGEVRLKGSLGYVVFTKQSVKRSLVSLSALVNAIGMVEFLKCVTVSISKVDKVLSETQKAVMFKESTGGRRLKDAGSFSSVISAVLEQAPVRH